MGAEEFEGSMLELDGLGNFEGNNLDDHQALLQGQQQQQQQEQADMSMAMRRSKQEAEEDFNEPEAEPDPAFSDAELKLQDYVVTGTGEDHVLPPFSCNVEEFRSKKYYLFNAGAHDLMITSLLDSTNPSASEISVADPSFQPLPWQNKRGITLNCAIEDRWRDFKAKLGVKIDLSRKRYLFHKRDASRYIPHTGQWLEIVKGCHIDAADRHWGRNLTKHQITKRWMYGERNHGIPESFVDAFIDSCGCCRREQLPLPPPLPPPPLLLPGSNKKRKLGKKLTTSMFDVQFIKQKLDEIAQQVAAAQFDRAGALRQQLEQQQQEQQQQQSNEAGVGEFERIDEDEQSKLKEKITAIRNEMDSMLLHLPSMSRGKFLHFLEAMDGALTELRNPDLDAAQAFATKHLPIIIQQQQTEELQKAKDDFLNSPKPAKRVKWKDMS